MVIEVKNVSKKFDGEDVLKGVSLTLEDGHIYGFVGPNGSGKSVFLKILCAFYEPSSGEVLFDGINVIKDNSFPKDTRALIEGPKFLPDATGKENLMLLASIQNKIGETEVDDILKKVGLYDDRNKVYHKYSVGMKQKLGIAQALMENPKIIILDEPLNGLDNKSAETIRNILLGEKKNGKIIIIATHIKDDITNLCDIVYKVESGVITLANNKDIKL